MASRGSVEIVNRLGLHARPAMLFAELAMGYGCDVRVVRGDQTIDGKSIMELMLLAASRGSLIEIVCEGDDADTCFEALRDLVTRGFDEDDEA